MENKKQIRAGGALELLLKEGWAFTDVLRPKKYGSGKAYYISKYFDVEDSKAFLLQKDGKYLVVSEGA